MKNQALFSSKDNSKKLKCRLLQFLLDTLRVKKGENLISNKLGKTLHSKCKCCHNYLWV